MSSINSKELEKNIKKNRINLFIALILLILAGVFFYKAYLEKDKKDYDPINMKEFIDNKWDDINKKVYINVATNPYLFAIYKTDGKEEEYKYYIVMDKNKKIYVIYMNDLNYKKLNKKDINKNPVRIEGITRTMPTTIQDLAIESYNKSIDEELLNHENFKYYLGLVYVDTTPQVEKRDIFNLIGLIILFSGLILLNMYLLILLKNKKSLKKVSKEELEKITAELSQQKNKEYEKVNLYFLNDYLIDLKKKIIILKYDEILWAYVLDKRKNGLLINKFIRIYDKYKNSYDIASTKEIEENKDDYLNNILKKLQEKNQDIIIGYNIENKKKYIKKVKTK